MKYIEVISRVIVKRGSQILLCSDKAGTHYFLPGGHVEFGDTIHKTVYKEFNEEMGLTEDQITDVEYLDTQENFYGEGEELHHEINILFSAKIPNNLEIISKEDHLNFHWKEISELDKINFLPKVLIPKIK